MHCQDYHIYKTHNVLDQTTYASLFYIKLKWLKDVKEFFRTRKIKGMLLA
jgi:hypothetical protein